MHCLRSYCARFQDILGNFVTVNNTALAQKQTCGPRGCKRRPKHECTKLQTSDTWQKCQDGIFRKRCWENWMSTCRWIKTVSISVTLFKNQLKVNQRLHWEAKNVQTARRKHVQYSARHGWRKDFLNSTQFVQELRSTIDKWGLIKLTVLCSQEVIQWRASLQSGREPLSAIHSSED